ncbi:MAG: HYR domain-containing protein [Saprospiraceae bacterium]|nr:HYR domain-containing protein [Saprospiraceae bacterium]
MLLSVILFSFSTFQVASAQECACKGHIQISLDNDCYADVMASMVLANGSTCGGTTASIVSLMTTPTGNPFSTGVGSAPISGSSWIGKTIYSKVTSPSGNSCWGTILIQDKLAPVIECPRDLTVTCYEMAMFEPVVTENCTPYTVNITYESISTNNCDGNYAPNVLKVVERCYQATDGSGNKSGECCMEITVVGLPSLENPYITMPVNRWLPDNTELACDGDWAKIPAGKPFAEHPSPVAIGTKFGTGVPKLLLWETNTTGAATVVPSNFYNNAITLTGGSTGTNTGKILGSEVCFTAKQDGTFNFNWNASMRNNAGNTSGGNFNNDNPSYSVNGVVTDLATSGNSASGSVSLNLDAGDEFCFQVYTMNVAYYTILNITNISGTAFRPLYQDLYPNTDLHCNLLVSFTDVKLDEVKCVTKYMRTWEIFEWSCLSVPRYRKHLQMIEVVDRVGPEFTCPDPIFASTSQHVCDGYVYLPAIVGDDNCSEMYRVDVAYPGGILTNQNGGLAHIPVGCHQVTYIAYDRCHNSTTCTVSVTVEDNTPPVTICDQNTNISLTSDGLAWVPAVVFDDGSYDECDLAKLLVKRMDTPSSPHCLPCKTPQFPGFSYLGEYGSGNQKHYYYLSKHRALPHVAFKTAKAMGGYVASITSAAENTFIFDAVSDYHYDEDYLIGLRDIKHKNIWKWESDEAFVYDNWAAGRPFTGDKDETEFVSVSNVDAKWFDFEYYRCGERDEYRYVVEIIDPCGFSEFVGFCCDDAPNTHMVQMRAIDKAGNYNDCMVNAKIEDKLPPQIVCPPHMTVDCSDNFDVAHLRHFFGWATGIDNCEKPTITTDSMILLNQCRIGLIHRDFTVTDKGNKKSTCRQTIHVDPIDPFVMTFDRWPIDVTIEGCSNPNDAMFLPDRTGKPDLITDNICSLVGYEFEDQVFRFNNSLGEACFKILRHWTVIDWCQSYIDDFGGTQYVTWKHTQIIKVSDKVKPTITSSCARKEVCTYDAQCLNGTIELIATATDNCTDELKWYAEVDIDNDGDFDSGSFGVGLNYPRSGNGNVADMTGSYPIGNHRIRWIFEDKCGNLTKCDQLFDIINCKAPTPYCLNGLATDLMPVDTDNDGEIDGGMVEIWAIDFDRGSIHPCNYDVILSFEPVTRNADGSLRIVAGKIFTCATLGDQDVKLYAAVETTPGGNIVQAYCETFINIQDNMNACDGDPDNRLAIKGDVVNPESIGIENVSMKLEGSEMVANTTNGAYNFENLNHGSQYEVVPSKDNDILNGVSTLDIVLIQRHILDIAKLSTPYKLIAADVNRDKSINSIDLVELRKVILGTNPGFTNNKSWRFIDKNYQFINPTTAQTEVFNEKYTISNLAQDMTIDFTGIKVGDVNGDAKANFTSNSTEGRSLAGLKLNTLASKFKAGSIVEIPVTVGEALDMAGMQMTFKFNNSDLEFVNVKPGVLSMNESNYGFANLDNGMITTSWNENENVSLKSGDVLMTLVFKATNNGSLENVFSVGSEITAAEMYTVSGNKGNISWQVTGATQENYVFQLYQNNPNPFKDETSISFDLPETMDATITIQDVTGKVLKVITRPCTKGNNVVTLNKTELIHSGMLYYTLEAGNNKASRKMIVIE